MEIIETTALITINETLWVQLILFLVFLVLINRIMFRPVQRNLADREAAFLSLRQDIHLLEEDLRAISDQAEAEEARLRARTRRDAEALREEGLVEASALMRRTLEDVKAIQQEAEARLKTALASARRQVEGEAEDLADAIIQDVLTRRIAP